MYLRGKLRCSLLLDTLGSLCTCNDRFTKRSAHSIFLQTQKPFNRRSSRRRNLLPRSFQIVVVLQHMHQSSKRLDHKFLCLRTFQSLDHCAVQNAIKGNGHKSRGRSSQDPANRSEIRGDDARFAHVVERSTVWFPSSLRVVPRCRLGRSLIVGTRQQ